MSDYKVLMAPVNISGQPNMLVKGLNEIGVEARGFQYGSHKFGYQSDIVVDFSGSDRIDVQLSSMNDMLEMDFDIFHFWFRTFFYGSYYDGFPGFDLPYIKAAGKKIVYRFTGYDLRLASLEKQMNPWNAYQYGFQPLFDEDEQKKYLNYLSSFVDQFVVQDIEMESYLLGVGLPQPKIVPRSINLVDWPYVGLEKKEIPLVIHAPSNSVVKGTPLILKAVEELYSEGLKFDFKLIENMPHSEAKEWYKKCDVAVDQILIGWYGVFSVECMALGKPVIVYIRDDLIESSKIELPPLIANPSNFKDILRKAILDYDLRVETSKAQRLYVEQVHDIKVVAPLMKECYDDVYHSDYKPAEIYSSLAHAQHQIRKMSSVSVNKVFLQQKSGISLNQDHSVFKLLKRAKRKTKAVKTNVRKKRRIVRSVLKKRVFIDSE